jgi:hypothetical protein
MLPALVAFFAFVAVVVLLVRWARVLAREPGAPRVVRFALAGVIVMTLAAAASVAQGLVGTFGAISGESVDPSQRARIVAEGISEGMNCFALGCVLLALTAGALAAATVWSRRRRP